jgi:hypothetical protein
MPASIFADPAITDRPARVRLRLTSAEDLEAFAARVVKEAYSGMLPASRVRAICDALAELRRCQEHSQLARRLAEVEAKTGLRIEATDGAS